MKHYLWTRWLRWIGLTVALSLALAALPSAQAQSDVRYFGETGHYLRGAFRYFWEANGGLGVFGYPVTEEFRRNGDGKIVQYFERARFELVQQGNQYSVALGRLGVEITGGRAFPVVPPITNSADRRYVAQTQHIVQYGFKTIWEATGAERVFGLPISEEIQEVIDDGEWHTVQYFERGRFEYWPQYAPGRRVLISNLGRRLAPAQLFPPLPPNAPPSGPVSEGGAPPSSGGAAPAPAAPTIPASVNASVTPQSGPPGTTFVLDAYGFDAGEKVGIWLTAPNQATSGADFQATADSKGSIAGEKIGIPTSSAFDSGIWSFNAQGVKSKRQAIGYFLITSAGAGGAPGNPANLGVPLHDQLPVQGQALIIPVAGPAGTTFDFLGGGFDANEEVSAWITAPDKTSSPLTGDQVAKQGTNVEVSFNTGGIPNGVYTVVAKGKRTGVIAAANFKLTNDFVAPPGTPRPANVNGTVTPQEGGQGAIFQLRGQGLKPGEQVQLWTTSPDGTYVLSPDNLTADSQGRIGYNPELNLYGNDNTQPGVYGFHFRGRSSGVRVDLYLTYTQ